MINIRKAVIGDEKQVTELSMLLFEDDSFEELYKEAEFYIHDDNGVVFLACDDSKVVGFAQCMLRFDHAKLTRNPPCGYLEGIYVCADYRKKGVAMELVKACEEWSKDKNAKEFRSDCFIDNIASLKFHLKAGFKESERVINFIKNI